MSNDPVEINFHLYSQEEVQNMIPEADVMTDAYYDLNSYDQAVVRQAIRTFYEIGTFNESPVIVKFFNDCGIMNHPNAVRITKLAYELLAS